MALQQTRELLRFTEAILRSICCRRFSGFELYADSLRKVLGDRGRRGPAGIAILYLDRATGGLRGNVFHLIQDKLVESSEELLIDRSSAYGLGLMLTEAADEVVTVNWEQRSSSVETFQEQIPPVMRRFMRGVLHNFIVCRIGGDPPGVITALNYPGSATDYDAMVLRSLAVVIAALVTLSSEVKETEKAFIYTIEALARACEAAEEHTGSHILRVNRYAGALAANMGLAPDFVEGISYSAQMHDVGKIKIPVNLLLKKGLLDAGEMDLMKMHPVFGEQILGDSPRLSMAREIAISHHENWDGSGYPYGLKGESIPLAGRIVKLADVYDALRSARSYKEPYSHEESMTIFRQGDARVTPREHFDPRVLETFFRIEHQFTAIYESLTSKGALPPPHHP